jgi:tryptophan 2,3-dioxygenase
MPTARPAGQVQAAYEAPSLYDEALRLLARRGLEVPPATPQRDWTQPYVASPGRAGLAAPCTATRSSTGTCTSWARSSPTWKTPFASGAFRHVTTVERVIGFKRGTGGTGGVSYLRKMLDVVLFPEIWSLRR